jgi:hypothetical protein
MVWILLSAVPWTQTVRNIILPRTTRVRTGTVSNLQYKYKSRLPSRLLLVLVKKPKALAYTPTGTVIPSKIYRRIRGKEMNPETCIRPRKPCQNRSRGWSHNPNLPLPTSDCEDKVQGRPIICIDIKKEYQISHAFWRWYWTLLSRQE